MTNTQVGYEELKNLLGKYKKAIDEKVSASVTTLGDKTALRDACAHALTGGKRFRAAIVLMVARALKSSAAPWDAALAIEYFHTASLIADDLPCMDDDDERRGMPTTHKVYGEDVALLASYVLISEGYRLIWKAAMEENNPELGMLALENVSLNTGIHGCTGGQYIDMYPPGQSLEVLREVLEKKTVTLFEISFVCGWLFAGGAKSGLKLVKKAAYHFGMAFQIVDDFSDYEEDLSDEKKVNFVKELGVEKAFETLENEIESFKACLEGLSLDCTEFLPMTELLLKTAQKDLALVG